MSTPLDERETRAHAQAPDSSQAQAQAQAPGHDAPRSAGNAGTRDLPARVAAALRRLSPIVGRPGAARDAGSAAEPFAATRRRLVATNVVAVALVLAILGVVVYVFTVRSTQQEIDAQLAHYAQFTATAEGLEHLPPSRSTEGNQGPPARIAPYSPTSPDLFTVVLDPSGKTLMDDDHIQQLGVPVVAAARPVLDGRQQVATTTVHAAGHDFRLYAIPAVHEGKQIAVVVEGVSLDVQDQQQLNLLRALALVFAVVLALTLLTSLYFTERALRPARAAFARQRQFAAAASHELRTPLAVIRSEAELAASLLGEALDTLRQRASTVTTTATAREDSGTAVTGQLEESLGETRAITAEVDYMTRMANELLLLARDTADRRAHEWQPVDLRAVLRGVADKIQPLAAREGLSLETPAPGDAEPAWVRGDRDLLRQLVYGLLDNAVRYTPAGGSIRVALRVDHRRVTLTISDTGVGIAPEHLAHIFEPFYRAISARPRREQQVGTGLGLALADWIVRAHGGTIAVRSTIGAGTTFVVELPLAPGAHPKPPEPSQDDTAG